MRQGFLTERKARGLNPITTGVTRYLPVNGRLGRKAVCFDTVTSTMDIARDMATGGAPEGAVVLAERQSHGRGRRGRTWHCPPGAGLLFSLLLRPPLKPEKTPLLTIAMALSLVDVGKALAIEAKTKWPNDVLILGRKVAGILGESGGDPSWIVLGMGINVNRTTDLPDPLFDKGIFVSDATGRYVDRDDLLCSLLGSFEIRYDSLLDGTGTLVEEWRLSDISWGKRVRLDGPDGVLWGVDEGLDNCGALLLRTDTGTQVRIPTGEVSLGFLA